MSHASDMKAERLRLARERARLALEMMTDEEDAEITALALSDPDNPPLEDHECLAPAEGAASGPTVQGSLWLDADVADRLMAGGADWKQRANAILREALERT